jgi:PKD repeat protein
MKIPSGKVVEDQIVSFEAVDLSDDRYDLPNLTVSWEFGDGSDEISGLIVNHTYTRKGSFRVTMTISDGDDDTEKTRTVIVDNVQPVANFSVETTVVEAGDSVLFDAGSSSDTPSDIPFLIFSWDFGDDSEGSGVTVNHTFDHPGIFPVKLSVFDDDGSVSEVTMTITVTGEEDTTPQDQDDGGKIPVLVLSIIFILILGSVMIIVLVVLTIMKRKNDRVPVQQGTPYPVHGVPYRPVPGVRPGREVQRLPGAGAPQRGISPPPPPLPPHP